MPAPEATRPRLYLLDGYALIYRAFFAMISRPLISSRGENTSAAFGVTRFLRKVFEQYKPEYLGVVFDAGSSMRHELLPSYKATREKPVCPEVPPVPVSAQAHTRSFRTRRRDSGP